MQDKILLIEDDTDFQKLVQCSLGFKYRIECASSFAIAKERIENNIYALILLDVVMPDGNGFDFFRNHLSALKNENTPIIFLTAKNNLADKIIGLSLGADDYITKPFDPTELLLHVDLRISKAQKKKYMSENICCGPIRLEIMTMGVYIQNDQDESRIDMTPIEFKILFKLIQNQKRILSRQQLIDGVWGEHIFIEDRSIDKHISTIRKKLGALGHSIKTVSGVGYEFQNISRENSDFEPKA